MIGQLTQTLYNVFMYKVQTNTHFAQMSQFELFVRFCSPPESQTKPIYLQVKHCTRLFSHLRTGYVRCFSVNRNKSATLRRHVLFFQERSLLGRGGERLAVGVV